MSRTARDATDFLNRWLGDAPTGAGLFQAKEAINAALRELSSCFSWSYFYTVGRIATSAPYSTGTVTYIHTGSTYERQLTLASGTFPSWAGAGVVIISGIAYQVDEWKSSTVLTFTSASNPGTDISSASTYAIYRQAYPLPTDFKAAGKLTLANNTGELEYMHPSTWLSLVRNFVTSANPTRYCILGNPQTPGNMEIAFYPFPASLYQIDMIYQRRPSPVQNWSYSDGTVSITSGAATLTGSGTTWLSRMAGASIRLSGDAVNLPTALNDANPYQEELFVKEFTSTTSMRTSGNAGATYSGVKYLISDILDVEEGAMYTALLRCAEWQLAILKKDPRMDDCKALWYDALATAKAADSRSFAPRGGVDPYVVRPARMPLGSDA